MNNRAKEFRSKYEVNKQTSFGVPFDPNETAIQIKQNEDIAFANFVKGTANEDLLAFKDPKVMELLNYIIAAIMFENKRINGADYFPIEIYRRYKSFESFEDKKIAFDSIPEKKDTEVTDYVGLKIIPEAEHSVFASGDDKKLQSMITKRERRRKLVVETYEYISTHPEMTVEEYAGETSKILRELFSCFPKEASTRRNYYQNKRKKLASDLKHYQELTDNPKEKMSLEELKRITQIDLTETLAELRRTYPNEVILYKLHSDLMRTFESSEVLSNLRNKYIKKSY